MGVSRSALTQALADPLNYSGSSFDTLELAAESVLAGVPIQWCETHNAESVENHGAPSDECWRVVWADLPFGADYELCRIVGRLLVEGLDK